MSLTLTTVSNGDVISAPALRAYIAAVEAYVNEGIVKADLLSTSWVQSTHIYGGSFYGAPNDRARFESGQVIYRQTSMDPLRRRLFHYDYTSGNAPVDGLVATFNVPEALQQGTSPYYDLLVETSFWCYEFGGSGATLDERTDIAANFYLQIDGSTVAETRRRLYAADAAFAAAPYEGGTIYCGKTHHMVARLAASSVTAGIHHAGVGVVVQNNVNVRHIIVGGRTLRASWYTR